jgi:hypothetical protein
MASLALLVRHSSLDRSSFRHYLRELGAHSVTSGYAASRAWSVVPDRSTQFHTRADRRPEPFRLRYRLDRLSEPWPRQPVPQW